MGEHGGQPCSDRHGWGTRRLAQSPQGRPPPISQMCAERGCDRTWDLRRQAHPRWALPGSLGLRSARFRRPFWGRREPRSQCLGTAGSNHLSEQVTFLEDSVSCSPSAREEQSPVHRIPVPASAPGSGVSAASGGSGVRGACLPHSPRAVPSGRPQHLPRACLSAEQTHVSRRPCPRRQSLGSPREGLRRFQEVTAGVRLGRPMWWPACLTP